jgi:hypothetical protein
LRFEENGRQQKQQANEPHGGRVADNNLRFNAIGRAN